MNVFKSYTENSVVIMGRKTYESIGKPLKNRNNFVISNTIYKSHEDVTVVPSLEYFMEYFYPRFEELDKDVYIIGGKMIYDEAFKMGIVEQCIVSYVNVDVNGDIKAPEMPKIFLRVAAQYFEKDDGDVSDMYINYYRTIKHLEPNPNYLYH
jgi:dihydrofolate reductase